MVWFLGQGYVFVVRVVFWYSFIQLTLFLIPPPEN